MEKRAWSAPPMRLNVNASPSESVAVTVVTAVVFSDTDTSPDVKTGSSAELVIVTVMV